jgi:hypothetical protein
MLTARRHPRHRAALAALSLTAALVAAQATAAHAALVDPSTGTGTFGTAPVSLCASDPPETWPSPPRVVVHTKGLTDSDPNADVDDLMRQVDDAVDQFNAMGSTSAQVASVSKTNDDTFAYKSTAFTNSQPTIHVGFVPDDTVTADNDGDPAGGLTTIHPYMNGDCVPTATIEFPDMHSNMKWSFQSPADLGLPFYEADDAALKAATGKKQHVWFRPSFEHELEHAFQLTHTGSAYAMMNHRGGGFPWGNRPDADAVRPLPDDVHRLRDLYPGSGSHWDVDVTNTWYELTADSKGGAGDQGKLCQASVGTGVVDDVLADGPCGTGGTNAGSYCARPGDLLATRYALNNYSTGSLHVTSTLSLSKNETWEATDAASSTTRTEDISAEKSTLVEQTWKVPSTSGTDLHPIVHVFAEHVNADGSVDASSLRIATMPLRGHIRVDRYCAQPTPAG